MKIVLLSSYNTAGSCFLTISRIKYTLIPHFGRVLGSTVGQGMQQKLNQKKSTASAATEGNSTSNPEAEESSQPQHWVTSSPNPSWEEPRNFATREACRQYTLAPAGGRELREGLKGLQKKIDFTQKSLEQFWHNVTDVWPHSYQVSVYESLIDRVAHTERYVALLVEMAGDVRSLLATTDTMLGDFSREVLGQLEDHRHDLDSLKEGQAQKEQEMRALREEHVTLIRDKNRQYDMLILIFGFQLITLAVCVLVSSCNRQPHSDPDPKAESRSLNSQLMYLGYVRKRCLSIH